MFKPSDLKPVPSLPLSEVIASVDALFNEAVDSGWYMHFFKDRIYITVEQSAELGINIICHREELKETYLKAGWSNVIIGASDEVFEGHSTAERPGLVTVELHR